MNKTEKHTFQIQLADGNFLQVENNYWDPSHPAEVYICIRTSKAYTKI